MQDQRWTIQELARTSCELLERQGIESPRLDVDLLLSNALGMERLQLYVQFDLPVDDDGRARFRELIKRRLTGEPVAYILGQKNFLEWGFSVNPAVLIPRPETEILVETLVALLEVAPPADQRFVEVGVGSGCITLSALLLLPDASAIAVDLSAAALEVAGKNACDLGVEGRVSLLESDLLQPIHAGDSIDLVGENAPAIIVSNPPYITDEEMAGLSVDVRDHEPHLALRSAAPLDLHKRICTEASAFLQAGGYVAFELPGRGEDELAQFIGKHWPHLHCFMRRDLAGMPRVFVAGPQALPEKINRYFSSIGNV